MDNNTYFKITSAISVAKTKEEMLQVAEIIKRLLPGDDKSDLGQMWAQKFINMPK